MKKRLNPRRIPVTKADLDRAAKQATDRAIKEAWAIFFTVLQDKEGYDVEGLQRVWREVDNLSDSILTGRITVADLTTVLREEYGVVLK